VLVIIGRTGVGKTTIVKSILRILAAKGVGLSLCPQQAELRWTPKARQPEPLVKV